MDPMSPQGQATGADVSRGEIGIWLCALCILFLATRPYAGIEQDGHYYAAMAARSLPGATLDQDLFFLFGNQQAFSLHTLIFAPLAQVLSLGRAHLLLWVLGGALWLTGLLVLARQVHGPGRRAFVAAALVLVLHAGYGNGVLSYGETFVTPRVLAEGFAMLALSWCLARKWLVAVPFLAAAAVLHPLTGLPVLTLALALWAGSTARFFALAGAGAGIAVALALAQVAPFTWLFQSFDDAWYALAYARDTIVFPLKWHPGLLAATIVLPVAVLLMVRLGQTAHERLAGTVLLVGVVLGGLSVIGAELMQNRLVTSLQLWRVLLFVTLFGNLLIAELWDVRGRHRYSIGLLGAALVLAVIERGHSLVGVGSAISGVAALSAFLLERRFARGLPSWARILTLLPVLAGYALVLPVVAMQVLQAADDTEQLKRLLRMVLILLVGGGLVWMTTRAVARTLAAALLAPCLLAVILLADDRPPQARLVEAGFFLPDEVRSRLDGRTVYWEDGLRYLWFGLHRDSYYSCRHKSGGIYFREQLFEFERRATALRQLDTEDFGKDPGDPCPSRARPGQDGPRDVGQIAAACAALPDLDVLVLRADLPGAVTSFEIALPRPALFSPWLAPGAPAETERYHVYECRVLGRRAPPDRTG